MDLRDGARLVSQQYAEIVPDQKVETWLSCHRSAFWFFSGVPARVVIDNPKDVSIWTCYHDPELQRTYDVNTGFVFDKSTGLELDTIDTTELYLAAAIANSNLDFSEWEDAIPNQLLGVATLDRLRHCAYRVIPDGNSYRCPRHPTQLPEKHLGDEVENHLLHTPSETLKSPLPGGSIVPIMGGLIRAIHDNVDKLWSLSSNGHNLSTFMPISKGPGFHPWALIF